LQTHKPKAEKIKRVCNFPLKKIANASKKIKIHRHTARQTMTQKLNINKTYSNMVKRRPVGNSTYKKLAVKLLQEAYI
jgi:hypothetical protein